MNKRKGTRLKRRIQLKFWNLEEEVMKSGFTFNVSLTGIFICTNSPFKPKTRIGIELGQKGQKFQVQAVVRHAARVDPLLQKVKPSGMGVRLIRTEELMAEMLGTDKDATPEKEVVGEEADSTEGEVEEVGTQPVKDDDAATSYSMNFVSPRELATCFERDLKFGGIFVPTSSLPEGDEVVIEFLFDWSDYSRVKVPAQVVKRFEAAEGTALGEKVTGIGVAFSDPEGAMTEFLEVIELSRGEEEEN